jgi:predicted Zn-dependent protease
MIEMDHRHLTVMMEAGFVYLGMRRFKEARAVFEGLHALAPASEVPLVAIGNVDFCENRVPAAIRDYREALKLDPESLFAKVYLGEALIFEGEREEGVALLDEVARADRGGAGDFARALLDALKKGFEPPPRKGKAKGKGKSS